MVWTLLASAVLALPQQVDTTVAVERGMRLQVNNHSGSIHVRVSDRSEVRVESDRPGRIRVSRAARTLRVGQDMRRGPTDVALRLAVPAWMPVELTGVETTIQVTGIEADVSAESVEGDITVRGGRGLVAIRAVDGNVQVEGTRGRLEVNAIDGDVRVRDVTGEIAVDAVDGDIVLERIASASVDATTVDGNILYQGTIQPGGRYKLTSHDGDVTLAPTGTIDATISVSTFSGNFESEVPVTITRSQSGGQRVSFVLGSGAARVTLESFDGTIRLRRAAR